MKQETVNRLCSNPLTSGSCGRETGWTDRTDVNKELSGRRQSLHFDLVRTLLRVLPLVLLMGIFSFSLRAEAAESRTVSTEDGEWIWEYWYPQGEETDGDIYSFGRCRNAASGEYLSGGWHIVDGCWYYFTDNGYAKDQYHGGYALGEFYNGGGTYASGTSPRRYKWHQDVIGWWYGKSGGNYLKNCRVWIDGKLYLFDENGYLPSSGWYQDPGTKDWYYILSDGSCATGWRRKSGHWYFFNLTTGKMYEAGGHDTRIPFTLLADNYVFRDNGSLREHAGWQQGSNGNWYYANSDGTAYEGWRGYQGRNYYFEGALGGQMAASVNWEWYQDGWYLNSNGNRAGGGYTWHEDGERRWYGNSRYYVANTMAYIDGWAYEFNEEGYCSFGWSLSSKETVEYPVMPYTQEELYLLAAVVYCEVGAESYETQLGVANVVINRMNDSRYPDNMHDVVYQKSQFTVVNSAKFERCLTTGGSETALKAAKEALLGHNNVPGCIGFKFSSSVDPNDPKYIIIDKLAFF